MSERSLLRRIRSARGNSLVEMVVALPALLLLIAGAVDLSRALYLSVAVTEAAHAGAQYGYQSSTTMKDSTGISNAATSTAPSSQVGTMTTSSVYGCMCSNWTTGRSVNCAAVPTCPSGSRPVNFVEVTTSVTYSPWFPWPGFTGFTEQRTVKMLAGQ